MNKAQLRKKYQAKRKQLSAKEISDNSLAIANQSLQLPTWEKEFYHLFLSIEKHNEIETQFLLHILQGKDKNVVVSKSDFSSQSLTHFLLTDSTKLVVNKWGIPEPENGIEIQPKQLDVVFVPLLAFDHKGYRVGYGKGFYDRFLSNCRSDVIRVGLSFFEAENTLISDVNEYDVALDYCVTPQQIYQF
ncbi:MAG: 5-formyltetrahydrofolate cyclo-ligase [Bacteroidota bacterium]